MPGLDLFQGEILITKATAQLAKGFPQTVGDLYLTSRRLVLIPNQVLSTGLGKRWEMPLARIKGAKTKRPFESGGTFVGSAGYRIVLDLDDNTQTIISSLSDFTQFHSALVDQLSSQRPSPGGSIPQPEASSATEPQAQSFICKTCGTENLAVNKFCANCGTPLANPDYTPPSGQSQPSEPSPVPSSASSQLDSSIPQPTHPKATILQQAELPTKDRALALILEILPGLFGLCGFGWIYSGNTNTGIFWLIGVLTWDFAAFLIVLVTGGFGCCCTVPMNLLLIVVSSSSLNTFTKKHPELFGA